MPTHAKRRSAAARRAVPAALDPKAETRLLRLARAIVDLTAAHVLVAPTRQSEGHWFGGGNAVRDTDGALLLLGRYRDAGDSRTGLAAGPRGRELTLFRSTDDGARFTRAVGWSKADIAGASPVLSIEGSALAVGPEGAEIYLSTERQRGYPQALRAFQKPGTGVWAIDRIAAGSAASLDPGRGVRRVLTGSDPAYLHAKDPNLSAPLRVGTGASKTTPGERLLIYCTHPYNWSSSGAGWARVDGDGVFALWQQSNRRRAQPLMGHRLTARRLRRLLG